jgi:beta-galactosidase
LNEVKHVYQYIQCEPVNLAAKNLRVEMRKGLPARKETLPDKPGRTVLIKNRYDFTDLSDIADGKWRVKADGAEIQSGKIQDLVLPPGASRRFVIPIKPFEPKPGVEYFLELSFALKRSLPWAKAGHEIAWDEFKLPDAAPAVNASSYQMGAIQWQADTNGAHVIGKEFEMTFDPGSGALTSWRYQGTQLVESPLRPDFWRAPTDNDRGRRRPRDSQAVWRLAHEPSVQREFSGKAAGDHFEVHVSTSLPRAGDAVWETTYSIYPTADVVVSARFKPAKTDLPKLPRLGMQLTMPKGFDRIAWFGPGPQETYSDRKEARVGVYSGTVDEQFYADYTEPGESGNKVDVRWLALTNRKGLGLLAVGRPRLSMNALHYTADDLQNAKHAFELTHRDFTVLNLDLVQQGLGGDDSWGAWPHDEFLIPCREYTYSFRLRPFSGKEDPAALARTEFGR